MENDNFGNKINYSELQDIIENIEENKTIIKETDTNSKEVSGILSGKTVNYMSRQDKRTVNLRLPEELLDLLRKTSVEQGISVQELMKGGIEKFIREQYIGKVKESEIEKILGNLSVEGLEDEVMDFMGTKPSYFAKGSEAEIFKMHIPGKEKDVLVVKRKYKGIGAGEFDLHSKIKEIEIVFNKNNGRNVTIPSLFHHFNKEGEEYILMEYIEGKTLYLMIIEAILSQNTIKLGELIKDEGLRKEFYYTYYNVLEKEENLNITSFDELTLKESLLKISNDKGELKKINLDSDESGENVFNILYGILKQANVKIGGDPDEILQLGNLKTKKFIYDMVNKSDFKGISLFSQKQAIQIDKTLNNFLNNMHDEGFYHRDLGNNTRNIMFSEKDGGFITTIIDFGKSKYYKEGVGAENPYLEESVTGDIRPANDNFIVSNYVSKLIKSDTDKTYKLINNEKEEILNSLFNIGEGLGAKMEDVKMSYELISGYKNTVYYDIVSELMESRKKIGGYELIIKNSTKNIKKAKEIESDNSKVIADLIVLMYFTKYENFITLSKTIEFLDFDHHFKLPNKSKYISLYQDIYAEIKKIRK